MKIHIYKYILENQNKLIPSNKNEPIGIVIIKHKEIIKTIALNKDYKCNGKTLDSDNRTSYELIFLDKYTNGYKYGKILIEYIISPGTQFKAFLKTNILQRIYLKLLFERYLIQRIKGFKQMFIGVFIGVVSAVVAGLILNVFTCG